MCQYESATYALQTASGNTKSWTVTGGQITGSSTGNSIVVLWNTAGLGTVSVTESTSLGCDSAVSVAVNVGPDFLFRRSMARSRFVRMLLPSYTTPSSANTTYAWSVTGGTITSNTGTGVSIRWNTGPSGVITLTAHNTSGCDSTVTRNVTINPTPVPVINGATALCQYESATYALQTASGNTKSWTVTGGQITGSSTGNSIVVLVEHSRPRNG
jgi:hypothetical protein